jgi:effector-binding domain-containing protein
MVQERRVEARTAQPYVAARVTVAADGVARVVDEAYPELFGWLAERGIEMAAAPFIRYRRIEMGGGELEMDIAVPVASAVDGDERVHADELPAGRYVTGHYVGPMDGLLAGNAELQSWAAAEGIALDRTTTPSGGEVWGAFSEHYLLDPSQLTDPQRWEVRLDYLAAR